MTRPLLLGAATLALLASPLAFQTNADAQVNTRSQAMTLDPVRGVLTMAPLLERVTPAVVSIRTVQEAGGSSSSSDKSPEEEMLERFFGGRVPQNRAPRAGAGSGVIFDARAGLIITNNHVIDDADEITVTLNDRREFEAELVGADPDTDIALLKSESIRRLSLALVGIMGLALLFLFVQSAMSSHSYAITAKFAAASLVSIFRMLRLRFAKVLDLSL